MTKREVLKSIKKELIEGEEKSVLFERYKNEIKEDDLRALLASQPSNLLRKEYKFKHIILSIIWLISLLIQLLGFLELAGNINAAHIISFVFSIYIAYNIWHFDGRFMIIGMFWFVLQIIGFLNEITLLSEYEINPWVSLILILMFSIIFGVGTYLMYDIKKHVFSYINWFQPVVDTEGYKRFE